MKNILGLDLGTTSIGLAFVREGEGQDSAIVKLGVRICLLSADEQKGFETGKTFSVNAVRTMKRGARRNLQRYKQRRENLIEILTDSGLIDMNTVLPEDGKNTTHSTYALRAMAATEEISKENLARVLLMINKKRGYKSSRKAKNEDEGQVIDGMEIAQRLYEDELTPGQLSYQLLSEGKKHLPDYYRSDLQAELNAVWIFQSVFYPEILTADFQRQLEGKTKMTTGQTFFAKYGFNTAETKGSREEKKLQGYQWRAKALSMQLPIEEVAFAIAEINGAINSSSGYLGAISDRSKALYFNKETVGQHQYKQLLASSHNSLRNQIFYRQDYLDEFNTIWEMQKAFHPELTEELKKELRDVVIFYQRRLKSQKGLVNFCEFEQIEVTSVRDGKKRITGKKVAPKSSQLAQEFKIWQVLNNLSFKTKKTKEVFILDQGRKQELFHELNVKGNLSKAQVLSFVFEKQAKDWDLDYTTVEGNRTNQVLYAAYFNIMEQEGHDDINSDNLSGLEQQAAIRAFFTTQGIKTEILDFNAEMNEPAYEQQLSYRLWHLLYSYEGDNSNSGNTALYEQLQKQFGFKKEHAQVLANVVFQAEYGKLSSRAIRKIYPFIKENIYSSACASAGYNHSSSITKEQNENRALEDSLELLPKNSLRNPVVEKILNQLVNVVNAVIADPEMGRPDEIRIELARELKKTVEERKEMTESIAKADKEHQILRKELTDEFGIKNPSRNDLIRLKLYKELGANGHKTLYSDTIIPKEQLFSKAFDIEHIIPKARLFDDSFSNKTICAREENLKKNQATAHDFVAAEFGSTKLLDYVTRVEMMYKDGKGAISKAKYKKLLMKASEIGEGFIDRDLRDSQYIAKKAKSMLLKICRTVVSTTGSITARLREDWDLVNVMQELNMEKYRSLGLTEMVEKKDGSFKERIVDWTKRNDHRHHAMDALTVAFTKHNHIQYLNNLNARKDEGHDKYGVIKAIEKKETELRPSPDKEGRSKRVFKAPMPNFREEAKRHLETIFISFKAKNKVVTKNKNKIKRLTEPKIQLTPRGQLHNETVYGKIKQPVQGEEKVGTKLDEAKINLVINLQQRAALLERLRANGNDPKKAFTGKNSLAKNPIYLDEQKIVLMPEKVNLLWFEEVYTQRKPIAPGLRVDKVIDQGVKGILEQRLKDFNGDDKKAFVDLEKNPIWLNEEKGIAIKRVTITSISNAEALHTKKNHFGQEVLNKQGGKIAVDFVSTSNNHHVAIYEDAQGALQEQTVSFYEAVVRVNLGLPVIDTELNRAEGWKFRFTMKQNEYFVFPGADFDPSAIDLMNPQNNQLISTRLFRVQKIASKYYVFRHHLETNVDEPEKTKNVAFIRVQSMSRLSEVMPVKVYINHLGQIVKVGEYLKSSSHDQTHHLLLEPSLSENE